MNKKLTGLVFLIGAITIAFGPLVVGFNIIELSDFVLFMLNSTSGIALKTSISLAISVGLVSLILSIPVALELSYSKHTAILIICKRLANPTLTQSSP